MSSMPLHERSFCVPDFESKLNLLQQRSARLYGVGEPRVLHLRKDIADALGINPSLLSRWSRQNRIPKMDVVIKLAELFGIEHAWLARPFEEFRQLCEGDHRLHTWRELMQLAQEEHAGQIEEVEREDAGELQMLHARPSDTFAAMAVQRVRVNATIRVQFSLPLSERSAPRWSGWHTVVLSQDPTGYFCLLPRYAGRHGFPPARLRHEARLALPLLTVDTPGLCSIILIASKDPLPEDLLRLLSWDDDGEAWRPAIMRMGGYFTPLVLSGRAGVLRLRYQAI